MAVVKTSLTPLLEFAVKKGRFPTIRHHDGHGWSSLVCLQEAQHRFEDGRPSAGMSLVTSLCDPKNDARLASC